MARTLYIHIGHFKTGTTALQVFCARNRAALAAAGIEYPEARCNQAKHSIYAFSLLKTAGVRTLMHGYDAPDTPEDLWAELFERVRASRAQGVLISSEEFMRLGAFPAAADRLEAIARQAKGIDIRILAWLRAPRAHLASWYNQLVKMGEAVPDYATAVAETFEPIHLDYGLALEPWRRIFGEDAVTLRPYDKASREDHGLIFDLLSVLGADLPRDRLVLPEADPNPGLDLATRTIMQLMLERGLPRAMIRNTSQRAQMFFLGQQAAAEVQPDLGAVAARIRTGLSALEALPGNGVDLGRYAAEMPVPEDAGVVDPAELVPFLLGEIYFLRHNLNETAARVAALEKAVEGAPRTSAPDPGDRSGA